LRPGEKLYEELLVGENPQKTNHPKIQKINDPFIPYDKLKIRKFDKKLKTAYIQK
jgi:FlaA1/EpsC-like NDP-sugar epimerase